jgi:hypothetical protein
MGTLKRGIALLFITGATSLLAGCFLQVLSGVALRDDDNTLVVIIHGDSIIAACSPGGFPPGPLECNYTFLDPDGLPVDVTSTPQLISEFGWLGVVIDPLVVQIPLNATSISGTYDDGAGQSGALVVRSGYKSIPVDVSRHLFAEHHQQFVIAELPDSVDFDGVQFAFDLTFTLPPGSTAPVQVKPLSTLKFTNTAIPPFQFEFISPVLPCTSDMTQIPAVSIQEGAAPMPIDLTADLPAGCDGEIYRYLGFGVFRCDFDEDSDVDSDDLRRQASVRNAPALPGDRLDTNGNGFIDLNDVRRCALQCTSPRCAVQGLDLELAGLDAGEDAS